MKQIEIYENLNIIFKDILDINEKTNPGDYQIVNKWIGQIDTVKNTPNTP